MAAKITQRILSDRALELVMLNVLGGLGAIALQPLEIAQQDCQKVSRCQENRIKKTGMADSTNPGTANNDQQTDLKLNS